MKENHGGIFRKLAFSSMIEPYIKLNQDVSVRELKLKELDLRLAELDKFKALAMSLREAQQLRQLQIKSSVLKNDQLAQVAQIATAQSVQDQSEDTVFVENKTLKITAHSEQNKVTNSS